MRSLSLYLTPILALLFLSSFLTETLTGSSPVSVFFQPIVFILFITVGYGFPVLIIREIYVRKNLSILSLFVLGFAYGLWNEGLFAQTIFYPLHSPILSFAEYGLIENIRVPFALTISSWHALYAVIYPILFVSYLFPKLQETPWISKKTAWILGIASVLFGSLGFFNNLRDVEFGEIGTQITGNLEHYVFLLIISIILITTALVLPRRQKTAFPNNTTISTKKLILYGIALYCAVFFLPYVFSLLKLPALLFFVYFFSLWSAGAYLYTRLPPLSLREKVLVGLSGEIPVMLLGLTLALLSFNIPQSIFVFFLLCLCIVLIRYVHIQKI
ncbi:hypothetical protein K2X96_02385 [Patescibacteria group bacterium]|nr:hypothetical protein [Patescibacteria group bacterium]